MHDNKEFKNIPANQGNSSSTIRVSFDSLLMILPYPFLSKKTILEFIITSLSFLYILHPDNRVQTVIKPHYKIVIKTFKPIKYAN